MSNDDNYLEEILDGAFEPTRKSFHKVFKIDNSTGETKLFPLTPVKIGEHYLDQNHIVIEPLILLNGKPLQNLVDKILVGKTHNLSGIFMIESWID